MKKFLLLFYFFIGYVTFGYCQNNAPAANDLYQKAVVLQKKLRLTNEQTGKIAAIFRESSIKLQKVITDQRGDTNKILAAISPLRTETIKKILLLLTPEQATKFKRLVSDLSSPNGDQWTPDKPRPIAP
jgi:hypothetical protein